MVLTSAQELLLKKFIDELKQYKARHTELVSVYIPQGYDLNKIINHLLQEQSTASNIKSKTTRDNVISALERMIQHLRLYKQTPKNGLAVFSGNVAEREGTQNIIVKSIEPPIPIKIRIYRCDKRFILDPLEDMLKKKDVYGLVVIDRKDALIALLKGKNIEVLVKTHSEVPGKFKAGGQSAPRFARLREGAYKQHLKKVADYMAKELLPLKDKLKGIIIGGPGPTKNTFVDGDYITGDLKKKIIGIKDIGYTGEFGVQELVNKSQDILAAEEIGEEKSIMQRFFTSLLRTPDLVAYGEADVIKALRMGAVDTLLVSERYNINKIKELGDLCKEYNSKMIIISEQTQEGKQLVHLGGIGAFLRYKIS